MNTPVNFEVCGADDYAQGYKNDRLYQDLGEDGRLYRRGWQMARLSDRTTQPTGESVAKPQERDPAAAEPEKAQEPTAITPPEAQPPQSLPAQGLDLFASPPPQASGALDRATRPGNRNREAALGRSNADDPVGC